jgi:6-pyruvoyltetrahydropterin/6-carboxytetrahydropterin synthase
MEAGEFTVTRQIGIDAGHRVMTHGSKCRHIHGHRYTIEATCQAREARLHDAGEQTDMVIDFSFLKDEMMRHIDEPCDHGFIASSSDLELLQMFCPSGGQFDEWHQSIMTEVDQTGYCTTIDTKIATKLYVLGNQTTAECLAAHWFHRLCEPIQRRSEGVATLVRVRVWETPNCHADYVKPGGAAIDEGPGR